jgi:hypothetical protein
MRSYRRTEFVIIRFLRIFYYLVHNDHLPLDKLGAYFVYHTILEEDIVTSAQTVAELEHDLMFVGIALRIPYAK